MNGPGGFQASVTLPDGSTFDGPVSAFKDEAAEGAATLALVKVKAPPLGTSDRLAHSESHNWPSSFACRKT